MICFNLNECVELIREASDVLVNYKAFDDDFLFLCQQDVNGRYYFEQLLADLLTVNRISRALLDARRGYERFTLVLGALQLLCEAQLQSFDFRIGLIVSAIFAAR
ncbi:hypothetical protein NKJ46_34280 [Mesorhizobium sp. M0166]|uniref:hypothetical protein n=1 Tax=Mesorhizobium sp. M0166 TaxID=2956902 RepID=UPI003339A8B5